MRTARTAALLLLTIFVCVCQAAQPDKELSCAPAIAGCKKIGGACVMLRFTYNGSCDAHCQRDVKKKIKRAGVSVLHEAKRATSDPGACVDYREDIGGTAEGAQCLASITGYEFHHGNCKTDGWPYSVIVP